MNQVTVTVNGQPRRAEVEPRLLLVHFLRDTLGLTGTHVGCDTSSCGACTVLLDGVPIKSCTLFAVQADEREVTTVEGLAADGQLHPVQQGFKEEHGLQCGFCTPGFLMTASTIYRDAAEMTDEQIREALGGQLCRCTGYVGIVRAVRAAAALERERA